MAGKRWSRRRLEKLAGGFSVAAGLVHGLAAPAHLEEWWGYGLFFLTAAAAQVVFGLALGTQAITKGDFGAGADQAMRWLLVGGVVGNLLIIGLYVVTRTVGVPWFGPEAGEVEPVGALDVASKIFELVLIALLLVLLRRRSEDDLPATA